MSNVVRLGVPPIAPEVLAKIIPGHAAREPFDPARRGFHAVYRSGETNHCPGCGRTHWFIGRATAECGFCATAIPLEQSMSDMAARPVIVTRSKGEF